MICLGNQHIDLFKQNADFFHLACLFAALIEQIKACLAFVVFD